MNIDALPPASHWTIDAIGLDKLIEGVPVPRKSSKVIHTRVTAGRADDKFITCWTKGAKVTLHVSKKVVDGVSVVGSDPRTEVLDGWTYDNSRSNALKLLALIRWHKGVYSL